MKQSLYQIAVTILIAFIAFQIFYDYLNGSTVKDLKHENYKLEKRIVQLETAYN